MLGIRYAVDGIGFDIVGHGGAVVPCGGIIKVGFITVRSGESGGVRRGAGGGKRLVG